MNRQSCRVIVHWFRLQSTTRILVEADTTLNRRFVPNLEFKEWWWTNWALIQVPDGHSDSGRSGHSSETKVCYQDGILMSLNHTLTSLHGRSWKRSAHTQFTSPIVNGSVDRKRYDKMSLCIIVNAMCMWHIYCCVGAPSTKFKSREEPESSPT